MSNTIINSNSNSALVSTLMESDDALVNPFVYAEKNIVLSRESYAVFF